MSRSFKKHPICGNTTAASEKEDKVRAHKKFRKKLKNKLREIEKYNVTVMNEVVDILPEKMEEVSDEWTFAKDGKQIVKGKEKAKMMRK